MILSMYESSMPMRFGVLLYSSKLIKFIEENGKLPATSFTRDPHKSGEDISSLIIRLFLYMKENYSNQLAFQFLSNVNNYGILQKILMMRSLRSKAKSPLQEISLKIEKESKFKVEAEESSRFVSKLGLSELHRCLLMNGLVYESNEDLCCTEILSQSKLHGQCASPAALAI